MSTKNKANPKCISLNNKLYTEAQAYLKEHPEVPTLSNLINQALHSYLKANLIEQKQRAEKCMQRHHITQAPVPDSKFYPANVTSPTSFGGPQTGGTAFIDAEAKQRMQAQSERNLQSQINACQNEYNNAESLYKQGKVDYQYWTAAQELYATSMALLQAQLKALRSP